MRAFGLHRCISQQLSEILTFFKGSLLNSHILTGTVFIAIEINNELIVLFFFPKRNFLIIKFCNKIVQNLVKLHFQRIGRSFLLEDGGKVVKNFSVKHCPFHNVLQNRPRLTIFAEIWILIRTKRFSLEIDGIRPLLCLLFNKTRFVCKMFEPFAHLLGNNALGVSTQ